MTQSIYVPEKVGKRQIQERRGPTGRLLNSWIGNRVKNKRKVLHLNQYEAAELLGISVQALRGVEQSGKVGPRVGPVIQKFLLTVYEKKVGTDGRIKLTPKS